MKITLLSATALALILSVPAFAAPHDHGGDHGDHATAPPAHTDPTPPAGGGALHGAPDRAHTDHPGRGDAGRAHGGHAATPPGNTNNTPNGAAILNGGGMMGTHHDRGGHNAAPTGGGMTGRGGQHAGHGHNNAFDALRRVFNAPRHFHHGNYQRPNGWYAHRWTYGEILPSTFFARNYWIDDYSGFGLSYPPPGTTWVRYGDDALLIDEDSGEVIQVVYGIFY